MRLGTPYDFSMSHLKIIYIYYFEHRSNDSSFWDVNSAGPMET